VSRKYRPEDQPWILKIGGKTGKKWVCVLECEGMYLTLTVMSQWMVMLGIHVRQKVGYISNLLSLSSLLGTWYRVSYLYGMSNSNTFVNINVEIDSKLDRKYVMRTLAISALHHILLEWLCKGGYMEQLRNAYKILTWKAVRKRSLGRPSRRWEDNIKVALKIQCKRVWTVICEHSNELL
jgi:hypothetical protein